MGGWSGERSSALPQETTRRRLYHASQSNVGLPEQDRRPRRRDSPGEPVRERRSPRRYSSGLRLRTRYTAYRNFYRVVKVTFLPSHSRLPGFPYYAVFSYGVFPNAPLIIAEEQGILLDIIKQPVKYATTFHKDYSRRDPLRVRQADFPFRVQLSPTRFYHRTIQKTARWRDLHV